MCVPSVIKKMKLVENDNGDSRCFFLRLGTIDLIATEKNSDHCILQGFIGFCKLETCFHI